MCVASYEGNFWFRVLVGRSGWVGVTMSLDHGVETEVGWWPSCRPISLVCLYATHKGARYFQERRSVRRHRGWRFGSSCQVAFRFGFSAEYVQLGKAWSNLACVRNTSRESELKHTRALTWHVYIFGWFEFISHMVCCIVLNVWTSRPVVVYVLCGIWKQNS
jgi:hypothetical protein